MFFRLLLAIPHLIVVALWGLAALAVSVIIWLALIFEGKAPRSLQGFVVSYLRYSVHVSAYLYLAAGPYPPFGGGEGYPIDVEIEPSARQSRGRVAARLVLAVPVLILGAAVGGGSWFVNTSWVTSQDTGAGWSTGWSVGGLAATAALLAWFASLARGRTPRGLRDLVVYAIGYTAQVIGYLLLVTDRYPTSDPTPHRPGRRAAAAPGSTRADRPARAVAAHRLLPVPPHDPAPDLAPPLDRARPAGRCSSPGSSRS